MIKIDNTKCQSIKSKKERVQCPRKKINGTDFCGYHKNSKNNCDNIINNNNNVDSKEKIEQLPYTYEELKKSDISDISMNRLMLTLKNKHKVFLSKTESITKEQLYKIIMNDLEDDSKYIANIDNIIKLQSWIRAYHIWKRRKVINNDDFYTLDNKYEIPLTYYQEIHQNKFRYCFDIRTLSRIIELPNPSNPYTSEPLTEMQIWDISRRIDYLKKNGKWDAIVDETILNEEQKFINKMIEVFHTFDMLDNYTDYKWFEELSLLELKKLYKYARDLWNFRAQIDNNEKKRIVREGSAFDIPLNVILNMRESRKRLLQNIILDEFRRFASEGVNLAERKLGVMLMLTALVNISNRAAYALPQYVQ